MRCNAANMYIIVPLPCAVREISDCTAEQDRELRYLRRNFHHGKGQITHRERLAPKYGNTMHGGRVCLSWPSSDNGTVEPGRDCVSGRRVSCLCLTSVSTVAKEPSAPGAEPPRGAAKPRKPGPCIYGAPYLIWPNCMRRWPNRPSATARSQPSEMFAMTQIARD